MQGLEGGDEVFRLPGSVQYGVMHNGGRSLRWSACARGALDARSIDGKGMDDVSLALWTWARVFTRAGNWDQYAYA